MNDALIRLHQGAWNGISPRYEAYALLLPGDPSFICQPHVCDAHCCRKFSVSVGESDRERMTRETAFAPVQFLESEDGEPITLPLARPYLLRRAENRCAMLGTDLGCSAYTGRPDACRQYPYQVLFANPDGGIARPSRDDALALLANESGAGPVALLVRHIECPGFTGEGLTVADWRGLRASTLGLQLAP
jgi:Fe-S-cluster containining protein